MSRKKKQPRPTPEELETQADEILRQNNEDLVDLIKRNTELMEQIGRDLLQPRNDPHYLQALQARDKVREQIANKVAMLHLVPDPTRDKTWVSAVFSHAEGEEMARLMSEHLEAPIQRYEGPSE